MSCRLVSRRTRATPATGALTAAVWALATKPLSSVLIALFLAWQLSAIVHLAVVPHTLCNEHGAVSHHDSHSDAPAHDHEPGTSDDECIILHALVHTGAAVDSPAFIEVLEAEIELLLPPLLQGRRIEQGRDRYRLAPSLSPPSVA